MTDFEKLARNEQAALEAAATWSERIRAEPSAELSQEFLHWIAAPLNIEAFSAVRKTMGILDEAGATPRILDMRRSALGRLRNAGASPIAARRPRMIAAAAAILIMVVAGGIAYNSIYAPQQYATSIGERRVISLADGSTVSLDSNSALDVRLTKAFRSIRLERGRARFDVAHDAKRPFTVNAGDETVVAVGTSFNVERLGPRVIVTLIQGKVLIENSSGSATARVVHLAEGEQMEAGGIKAPAVHPANLEAAMAWETGHLVFRGESLEQAVERVNRYMDVPISVAPSVASIPISGVFNAGDASAFLGAITSYLPIDAIKSPDGRVILQRRPS